MARVDRKNERKQLDKVLEFMKNSENFRKPYEVKWLRYYKMYRNFLETKRTNRSNLFIPYTFSMIESALPQIALQLIPGKEFFHVRATEESDMDKSDPLEIILRYQLGRTNFFVKGIDWIKECLIYGTAYAKVWWHRDIRETTLRQPFINAKGFKVGFHDVQKTVTLFNGPMFEPVDIWSIYPEPNSTWIYDPYTGIIQKSWKTKEQLEVLAEQGKWENVSEALETSSEDLWAKENERYSAIGMNRPEMPRDSAGNPTLYECLEYQEDDKLIVVVNREVVTVKEQPNPTRVKRKTYLQIKDISVPHEHYGIGEVEAIEGLQDELNQKRNQRMDNVNLIINRMWKVARGARVDISNLVSRPGHVILTDDMDGIEALDVPDVTASAYKEEEIVKADMQTALGNYEYSRGATPERREAASTVVSLQGAANSRYLLKAKMIAQAGIEPLLYWFTDLNLANLEQKQSIRIAGKSGFNFKAVNLEDLPESRVDFEIEMETELPNRDIRRNQFLILYQAMSQRPTIDQYELDRMMLKEMDAKNLEKILVKPNLQDQLQDPVNENLILAYGQPVEVRENQDHAMHLQIHQQFSNDPANAEAIKDNEAFATHIKSHEMLLQGGGAKPGMPAASVGATDLMKTLQGGQMVGAPGGQNVGGGGNVQ